MSQDYILRRLMQNGGGCGSCPTCGQEGGRCPCSGGNDFNGGGCGSCSTCGQEGGGCGCSGNGQDGGKVSRDSSKWTFVFFNAQSANAGKSTDEDQTHANFLTHVKIMDDKGKVIKKQINSIADLIVSMQTDKVHGYYINENLLFGKLNKEAFKTSGGSQTVEFIDLKRKAVKEVVKKAIDGVASAAEAVKAGLIGVKDQMAFALALDNFSNLSDPVKIQFFEVINKKLEQNCKYVAKTVDVSQKGGYTESFDDNTFVNSIFGNHNDEFIYSDSEPQFGGVSFKIPIISEAKDKLKNSIAEIEKNVRADAKLKDLKPAIPAIDSVIFFEKRMTGPAKIVGLLSGNEYVNIFD